MEKENKELKKTLDESEKSFKEKLSSLAVEMEQLKLKLKERSKTPEVDILVLLKSDEFLFRVPDPLIIVMRRKIQQIMDQMVY